MAGPSLDQDTIIKRINGIQNEVAELREIGRQPFEVFADGVGFKLAQFHLHRALEGVFHIAGHILSRIPGGQATEYKEMARKLGEFGVVDKKFAQTALVQMAGYRNRIVHFYAEITPQEMYELIQNNLKDFDVFLTGVKRVLANPAEFNIES